MANSTGLLKRNNVWYIRYDLPRGFDGKRIQKMEACPGLNKKQAEELRNKRIMEIRDGNYVDVSSQTLKDYLITYLEREKSSLADYTISNYQLSISKRIIPFIGNIKLDKLKPMHVQHLYDELVKLNYSAKTIKNTHGVLHIALKKAQRLRIIRDNPTEGVTLPRYTKTEMTVATLDEVARLYNEIQNSKHKIAFYIILATACRRGEALGFKWTDYDREKGTIALRRSVTQSEGGEIYTKEPKSKRSSVIRLPATMISILDNHKATQTPKSEYISTDSKGQLISPRSLSEAFSKICRKLGINIGLHGLRHTQASELISRGIPVKAVSERLTHANITITQDNYAHVLPHTQDAAAQLVDELFFKKIRGKSEHNVCKSNKNKEI